MKRYGNLFEQVVSIENLELADENARKNKKSSYGVRVHDRNREENLRLLHKALSEGTWKTSRYETFTIREPKERLIYRLPYYPDRIVHHAVMNVCGPLWLKSLPYNTYSCVRKRGITGCAKQVRKILDSHDRLYCLKIDVSKFYPSVDHDIMKRVLRRKIKDERLLTLLDGIVDSAPGLPIGNYLSQYWANLYLAGLMHKVNRELKLEAAEYADDIVIFSPSKEVLHNALAFIREYLEKELKLKLKRNWQVFPVAEDRHDRHGRGVDYVGYVFYMKHTALRKRIKKRFCRTAARVTKLSDMKTVKRKLASGYGWLLHCDGRTLWRKTVPESVTFGKIYKTCGSKPQKLTA